MEAVSATCNIRLWRKVSPTVAPEMRNKHAAVTYRNKLFLFGGYCQSTKTYMEDLWIFDFDTQEWELADTNNKLPARRAHSMTVFGNQVVIFGGYNGVCCTNDLISLNLDTLRCTKHAVVGEIAPRGGHSAVVWKDRYLVIHGGWDINHTYHNSTHAFDLGPLLQHKGNYSHLDEPPSVQVALLSPTGDYVPQGRVGHACVLTKDEKMLMFGGYGAERYWDDLNELDFKTGRWRQISSSSQSCWPQQRTFSTMCYNPDTNRVILIGGSDNYSEMNDVNVLQCDTLTWERIPCTGQLPSPRFAHTALFHGHKVYVFGGVTSEGNQGENYMGLYELTVEDFSRPTSLFHLVKTHIIATGMDTTKYTSFLPTNVLRQLATHKKLLEHQRTLVELGGTVESPPFNTSASAGSTINLADIVGGTPIQQPQAQPITVPHTTYMANGLTLPQSLSQLQAATMGNVDPNQDIAVSDDGMQGILPIVEHGGGPGFNLLDLTVSHPFFPSMVGYDTAMTGGQHSSSEYSEDSYGEEEDDESCSSLSDSNNHDEHDDLQSQHLEQDSAMDSVEDEEIERICSSQGSASSEATGSHGSSSSSSSSSSATIPTTSSSHLMTMLNPAVVHPDYNNTICATLGIHLATLMPKSTSTVKQGESELPSMVSSSSSSSSSSSWTAVESTEDSQLSNKQESTDFVPQDDTSGPTMMRISPTGEELDPPTQAEHQHVGKPSTCFLSPTNSFLPLQQRPHSPHAHAQPSSGSPHKSLHTHVNTSIAATSNVAQTQQPINMLFQPGVPQQRLSPATMLSQLQHSSNTPTPMMISPSPPTGYSPSAHSASPCFQGPDEDDNTVTMGAAS
eukprot:TRINITY_DN63818_c0_g2_i1.p1 TRINITY_DN63818_c0_g2~~TRINITY_DN63818_c0_g2_i1.p1  ORF type:complete len:866 (-),score=91.48 TRINITY_DN63818_c0_g2_i1:629-3166(-)